MRMNEHGLASRENTRMYTRKPKCVGHGGSFITASLIDTKPAIIVLLTGYLIAFTALVMELITKCMQQKRMNAKR